MNLHDYNNLSKNELIDKLKYLKKEKDALIIAHNYQLDEVQEIADYLGDSYGLSVKATETKAKIILFAGVRFMAETAKILNPDSMVLIPDINAGCPLADCADIEKLREFKKRYPDYTFVAYVNSSVEIKAEVDIVCTSRNAVKIIQNIPSDKIVFLPDTNLGRYVKQSVKDKDVILWDGGCYVHTRITVEHIKNAREKYPNAKIIVHPEAPEDVTQKADAVLSTEGMLQYVKKSNTPVVIGTEIGIIDRIKREMPDKIVFPLKNDAICFNMKMITLPKLVWSLDNEKYQINIPEDIRLRAENSVRKMLEYSAK